MFILFFFLLLRETFEKLLDKNSFKSANILRKYRSAVIFYLIGYVLALVVYLTYDSMGLIPELAEKWL